MNIPFSAIDCSGNEEKYVRSVLESGWLTSGGMVERLEHDVTSLTGAKYGFAVNSCTSALHLGLEALGVGLDDTVLVPSMTFTASVEVVRYVGAHPVFLDVDYGTRSLTPAIVKDGLDKNPSVKALIVVHYGGQAAQMLDAEEQGIRSICQERGVRILEDAAHAFPAKDNGEIVGNLGDITCFSFYANKTMTTGEGGMLLTSDEKIAERIRVMRLHGIDRNIWDRYTKIDSKPSWDYDILAPGFKYNMADLNAAVGVAQFERLEQMRLAREAIALHYYRDLSDISDLDLQVLRGGSSDHAWHLFTIVVKPTAKMNRDELIASLVEDGIGTSVHYRPLHRMTYYKEKYGLIPKDFPDTERLWKGLVSLPLFSSMSTDAVGYVVDKLREKLI